LLGLLGLIPIGQDGDETASGSRSTGINFSPQVLDAALESEQVNQPGRGEPVASVGLAAKEFDGIVDAALLD
jgi:hypothetical protein